MGFFIFTAKDFNREARKERQEKNLVLPF